MNQEITREFVEDYLEKKIDENEKFFICTFYDVRFNQGVTAEQVDKFLEYAKEILEDLNYQVYFTGARYQYLGARTVQDNEYLAAIKNEEER